MIVTNASAAETLTIRTLGGLRVYLGDVAQPAAVRTITFETHAAEALLIYLAYYARPLGRDDLAELLWPERAQKEARSNLRITIFRLRKQLVPYLLVTRQSVALNLNARIELDAVRFETYLAAGELAQATALYRGDFLDGFYLDSSPDFEQWALRERERLRTLGAVKV